MILEEVARRGADHQRATLQALIGQGPSREDWVQLGARRRVDHIASALRRYLVAKAGHLPEVTRQKLVEVAVGLDLLPSADPEAKNDERGEAWDLVGDHQMAWWIAERLLGDAEAVMNDESFGLRLPEVIGRRIMLQPEPTRSQEIARLWTRTRSRSLTEDETVVALTEGKLDRFDFDPAPPHAAHLHGLLVLDALADAHDRLNAKAPDPSWPLLAPAATALLIAVLLREPPKGKSYRQLPASSAPTKARRARELRGLAALALSVRVARLIPPEPIYGVDA